MNLEYRDAPDGSLIVDGYASRTETGYDMGSFTETIARGAFTRTLARVPDVVLRIEHEPAPVLARTKAGSLQLREDASGLMFEATLDPADRDAQDASRKVRAGLLSEASFAFRVEQQTWSDDYTRRRITQVNLDRGDVSLVAFGANPTATSLMRAVADTLHERRAFAERIGDWCGPLVLRHSTGALAVAEYRGDYTESEKAELGKDGKAIWLDGHWAFPVANKSDFDDAVQSVRRTPGKNRIKVRKYLIALAKKNGWPIPASWNADGTTKASGRSEVIPFENSAAYCDLMLMQLDGFARRAGLPVPARRSRVARGDRQQMDAASVAIRARSLAAERQALALLDRR